MKPLAPTASAPVHRSTERRLVLLLAPLLIAAQVVAFGAMVFASRDIAMAVLDDDLEAGTQVFDSVTTQRNEALQQTAMSIAKDYGLGYAIVHGQRRTVDSALANQLSRSGANLIVLTDMSGQVIGKAMPAWQGPQPTGPEVPDDVLAARVRGIVSDRTNLLPLVGGAGRPPLYEWVKATVRGPQPLGRIYFAYEVDDARAQAFARMTHLDFVYLSREGEGPWRVHASTFTPEAQRGLGYHTNQLPPGIHTVSAGGVEYRMTAVNLGGAENSQVAVVVAKSLHRVLAPFSRLALITGGLILFSIIVSVIAARRVTRRVVAPLDVVVYQDGMTGLANRRLFELNLQLAAQNLESLGRGYVLMVMDLNKFKAVNDTLGHAAGDEVLREAARRIRSAVRDSDTIARLGGDEFALLLLTDDRYKASEVAAQIVRRVREPMLLSGGVPASVGVSIGIVRAPEDGRDTAALLHLADTAMYAAKTAGCGFVFATDPPGRLQAATA